MIGLRRIRVERRVERGLEWREGEDGRMARSNKLLSSCGVFDSSYGSSIERGCIVDPLSNFSCHLGSSASNISFPYPLHSTCFTVTPIPWIGIAIQ